MVLEQMLQLRNQYGKLVSQKRPKKDFEITANFKNEESNVLELPKISCEYLSLSISISENLE